MNETIKTHGHTTQDGMLNLSVNVGLADVDVTVVIQMKPLRPAGEVDENGWPKDFFERVAGSMPELRRSPQGEFEKRLSLPSTPLPTLHRSGFQLRSRYTNK